MERRRSERKKTDIHAEIISGEITYNGTIENLAYYEISSPEMPFKKFIETNFRGEQWQSQQLI